MKGVLGDRWKGWVDGVKICESTHRCRVVINGVKEGVVWGIVCIDIVTNGHYPLPLESNKRERG